MDVYALLFFTHMVFSCVCCPKVEQLSKEKGDLEAALKDVLQALKTKDTTTIASLKMLTNVSTNMAWSWQDGLNVPPLPKKIKLRPTHTTNLTTTILIWEEFSLSLMIPHKL